MKVQGGEKNRPFRSVRPAQGRPTLMLEGGAWAAANRVRMSACRGEPRTGTRQDLPLSRTEQPDLGYILV